MASALLISKDVAEGVMDRFRSMPIARSAVPFGRTAADLLGAAVGVAIMALIALLAAWRELFGNPTVLAAHASLPLRHPAATTIGWALLILLIFVPLSARRHQAAGR